MRKTRRLVRAAGVGGAEGAEARSGDVRSSWSRGLPPAADVRTVNNPERSVEGGDSRPFPEERPSPAAGPPRARDGGVGRARARVSERTGGRDLAGCAALLRLPDGGARTGRVASPEAAAVTRGPLARRGLFRGAWAEPALLVPE